MEENADAPLEGNVNWPAWPDRDPGESIGRLSLPSIKVLLFGCGRRGVETDSVKVRRI